MHSAPTTKQTLMTLATSSGLRAAGCRCGSSAGRPEIETGARCSSVIALTHPEAEEGQGADAEGQTDEPFGDRSETTEAETAGVVGVLDLGRHVLHDVVHLGVAQVAREARHVAGSRSYRLGDLD